MSRRSRKAKTAGTATPTTGSRAPQAGNAQIARRFESARQAHAEGRLAAAERECRRILKRHAEHPDVLHLLGLVMRDSGRAAAAIDLLERALIQKPRDPVCLNNLGNLLREQNRISEAINRYRAAVGLDPGYVSAVYNLGAALMAASRPEQASECFLRAIELRPDDAEAWSMLGAAYLDLGRDEEALGANRRALELRPDSAGALNELGLAHADRGDFDDALDCYRRALEIQPLHLKAALNLAKTQRFESGDEPDIALVERSLAAPGLDASSRGDLHYALGKINDDCGRYEAAFGHYQEANRGRAKHNRYDPDAVAVEVTNLIEVFDEQFFSERGDFGDPSELPVFIIGMPRSGTSLVEQILAAHAEVYGAGELTDIADLAYGLRQRLGSAADYPTCVPQMDAATVSEAASEYLARVSARAPDAARITDKLPGNFLFLGLIGLIFPRARIVVCRRHPMDVALSIYFTDFNAGHHYSYKLEHIAAQFRQFARVMDHWRRVIPSPVLELRYEDLVTDPEAQIRPLLEFCGLDWDERCLRFQDVRRPVHTASFWQVRQPLYASSVGRWRRYERHLEPLKAALGPLAAEAE
jgi:tetratricopeptide (TPR) repeat protein